MPGGVQCVNNSQAGHAAGYCIVIHATGDACSLAGTPNRRAPRMPHLTASAIIQLEEHVAVPDDEASQFIPIVREQWN